MEMICFCKRIIIIDDEEFNLMALSRILRSRGYEIFEAYNGYNAIELLRDKLKQLQPCTGFQCCLFSCIITDINMPVMDGYTLATTLKQEMTKGFLPLIPIIGYSAYVSSQEANKCYESGMDLYLAKPIPIEDLNDEVQRLVHKRDYLVFQKKKSSAKAHHYI